MRSRSKTRGATAAAATAVTTTTATTTAKAATTTTTITSATTKTTPVTAAAAAARKCLGWKSGSFICWMESFGGNFKQFYRLLYRTQLP